MPGGLAGAAARLASGLAAHRPVDVFAPDPRLGPDETVREGLVTRFGARDVEALQRRWFELVSRGGPYGLVHAVYPSLSGFAAVTAAAYLNIPCLLAARGNDLDRDAFRPGRQAALLHALGRADAVVGVSRDLVRVARALGARAATWIPNGVDAGAFPAQPPHDGPPTIAFIGQARWKKGLPTMLEAIQQLPGTRLLLIGGLRDEGPLPPGVEVLPTVAPAELPALLRGVDLCWHPSYQDGLPNAVLEALACERVVVGTPVGGLPDVLDADRLPGLIVPRGDARALADVTRGLLADGDRRLLLARAGRAWVQKAFSPEAEVRAYLDLYAGLISQRA